MSTTVTYELAVHAAWFKVPRRLKHLCQKHGLKHPSYAKAYAAACEIAASKDVDWVNLSKVSTTHMRTFHGGGAGKRSRATTS